jgi:hypothetical protein
MLWTEHSQAEVGRRQEPRPYTVLPGDDERQWKVGLIGLGTSILLIVR